MVVMILCSVPTLPTAKEENQPALLLDLFDIFEIRSSILFHQSNGFYMSLTPWPYYTAYLVDIPVVYVPTSITIITVVYILDTIIIGWYIPLFPASELPLYGRISVDIHDESDEHVMLRRSRASLPTG